MVDFYESVFWTTLFTLVCVQSVSKFLDWFGFSAEGIRYGSYAASLQRRIGRISAQSSFAALQRIGTSGLSAEISLGLFCAIYCFCYCIPSIEVAAIGAIVGYAVGCLLRNWFANITV